MTGLQIWNSSGNLTLDTDFSVARFVGISTVDLGGLIVSYGGPHIGPGNETVTVANGSGTFTSTTLTTGTPFYVWVPQNPVAGTDTMTGPSVVFSGSTMTWTGDAMSSNGTLILGVK